MFLCVKNQVIEGKGQKKTGGIDLHLYLQTPPDRFQREMNVKRTYCKNSLFALLDNGGSGYCQEFISITLNSCLAKTNTDMLSGVRKPQFVCCLLSRGLFLALKIINIYIYI